MTGYATIARHLEQLQVFLERLHILQGSSREALLSDWQIQTMVERSLHLAIEAVISVSEQLIAALSLPTPQSGRAAVAALAEARIIQPDLAAELQQAVAFRNILVHQYTDIDYDIIYDVLHNKLVHIEAFLGDVSRFVQSQP